MRALGGLLVFLLAMGSSSVRAQTAPDVRARVEELGKEVESLRAAAAETATLSRALADLSAEIERLKARLDEAERGAASGGGAARFDAIDVRLTELTSDVSALRAAVQAEGAPESAAAPGGGTYDGGFVLASGDGRYTLRTNAYAQLRFTLRTDEVLENVDEAAAALRRARIRWRGNVHSDALMYCIQLDFGRGRAELLDYYVEGRIGPIAIRGGQFKLPFTRAYMTRAEQLSFVERSVATEEFRYDRDLGLMVSGSWPRVEAHLSITNGAGRNVATNDNLDPLIIARVAANLLGKVGYEEGDLDGSRAPGLAIGVNGSFENAPVPDLGETFNGDVDGDGRRDNVRVMQAGVDVAFRLRGFGLEAEAYWRKEDWGTIGDAQTPAIAFDDMYLGAYAQASYFILPGRFQVGARYSYTEVSPLRVGGKSATGVEFDVRKEISVLAAYYRWGHGVELSAMWSFLDWGVEEGTQPKGVGEQRFLVEAQVGF